MCKDLKEDRYIESTVGHISNHLTDDKYILLDEYYVVNQYKDQDTIRATSKNKNLYILEYPGVEREMYIAFFYPQNYPQ